MCFSERCFVCIVVSERLVAALHTRDELRAENERHHSAVAQIVSDIDRRRGFESQRSAAEQGYGNVMQKRTIYVYV